MESKMLELRDRATHIPVLCTAMVSFDSKERYLLRRLGFGEDRLIQLTYCDANMSSYDSYHWGANPRTLHVAHKYIEENWDTIRSGDVIDVEFILGERATVKKSENINPTPSLCDRILAARKLLAEGNMETYMNLPDSDKNSCNAWSHATDDEIRRKLSEY